MVASGGGDDAGDEAGVVEHDFVLAAHHRDLTGGGVADVHDQGTAAFSCSMVTAAAAATVCWIGAGQPDAAGTNTLILRFNTAADLASSDDELVAQRCGSVPADQPAPKLRAVAEGPTWVVGDSGTHGGIWGAKDEAADAPAVTTAAARIASALGGKVLQRSC